MTFAPETDVLTDIVRRRDPSFKTVDPDQIAAALSELASERTPEGYMLAAMRLMALPGNAHTRIIPNAAIKCLPLRFVALGTGVYLTAAPGAPGTVERLRLRAINDVPVKDVLARAAPFLAGTPQRRRVIGGLLLVWPAALESFGINAPARYTLEDGQGRPQVITLSPDRRVPATDLYPLRDKGGLLPEGDRTAAFATCTVTAGPVMCIRLPDFYDPTGKMLDADIAAAAGRVAAASHHNLILDLRGNPGGNFMRALPLADAIAKRWQGTRCLLIVDKFTFSAAIVFTAILKAALKDRLRLVGEPMGDETRFYAEGEALTLPVTGATARYSTAWHDWQTGTADLTTPTEIAAHLVAAGDLAIDHPVHLTAQDMRRGRDPVMDTALALAR